MSLCSVAMRERLSGEQNHRCAYCGEPFSDDATMTVDHVIPRRFGGANAWPNYVAACEPCNQARGAEDAHQFYYRRGWEGRRRNAPLLGTPRLIWGHSRGPKLADLWPAQREARA